MFHGDICTVSIITWGLDTYGHFNDVILNLHQVYSIGGATHIHNLNNCPLANAFLCKKNCLHICGGLPTSSLVTLPIVLNQVRVVICGGLR